MSNFSCTGFSRYVSACLLLLVMLTCLFAVPRPQPHAHIIYMHYIHAPHACLLGFVFVFLFLCVFLCVFRGFVGFLVFLSRTHVLSFSLTLSCSSTGFYSRARAPLPPVLLSCSLLSYSSPGFCSRAHAPFPALTTLVLLDRFLLVLTLARVPLVLITLVLACLLAFLLARLLICLLAKINRNNNKKNNPNNNYNRNNKGGCSVPFVSPAVRSCAVCSALTVFACVRVCASVLCVFACVHVFCVSFVCIVFFCFTLCLLAYCFC